MESVDGNEGAPQNAAPTPSTRRFLHTLLGKSFTVSLATKIVAANVAVDIIKEFNAEAAQHVVPLKSNANYVEFKEIVENLSAGAKFLIECAVPAVRGSVPAPGSSTATLNSTASSSSSPAAATTVVPKGTGAKRSADGLGRGDEGAAVMDAAIPAAKLQKASSHALLATACVHACPIGAATCIRWASCAPHSRGYCRRISHGLGPLPRRGPTYLYTQPLNHLLAFEEAVFVMAAVAACVAARTMLAVPRDSLVCILRWEWRSTAPASAASLASGMAAT